MMSVRRLRRTLLPLVVLIACGTQTSVSQLQRFGGLTNRPPNPKPASASGQGVEILTATNLREDGSSFVSRDILDVDPSNGSLIQVVRCSTEDDINATVWGLKERGAAWSTTPLDERVRVVRRALSAFEGARGEELIRLISREMGKTIEEATEEVEGDVLDGIRGPLLDLMHEANKPELVREDNAAIILRDPLGVVAVISPWNFPAAEILLHAIPALVAGNAVIVKPSEVTPLVGEFVVRTLLEGSNDDLPIGIVQGDGVEGAAVVGHPGVDLVSMTGSSATGKKIMEKCGRDLKRLILELGGKDPMIVFKDADLQLAAKDAVRGSTYNCGQACCSIERIYVESSVKTEFERLLIDECKKVKAGTTCDDKDAILMGPMVSRTQRDIVAAQVGDAVAKKGKILFEGDVVASPEEQQKGNYYPATVLTDLNHQMLICQKETFGPLVAVHEFDGSENAAVELANDSLYGLTASVYSADLEKCARVASSIRAGQVGVNAWAMDVAPYRCPWVGHRESGHNYHSGIDGYRMFSVPKSVIFRDAEVARDGKNHDDSGDSTQPKKKLTVGELMKSSTSREELWYSS